MKQLIILATELFLLSAVSYAQVPPGFNYQALAIDGSGNPLKDATLEVRIAILSDTVLNTILWEELHSSVKTNKYGLFSLVVGNGAKQPGSADSFAAVNWNQTPLFIRTQIFGGGLWKTMGSAVLWSVPYSMISGDLDGEVNRLTVVGDDISSEEPLFEVRRKDGQVIFGVYNHGVRINMPPDTLSKGKKSGFAIGGFGTSKETVQDYFTVNSDSIRAYINTDTKGGKKGGFAIGGFSSEKKSDEEYLRVTTDSVKVSKSLLIPRLTTEERDNLPFTPGEALIIFNISEGCMQIFKNNVWSNIWCFNCAPSFIIQPVDMTICSGDGAVFFVSATGTSLNYQWQQSNDNGNTWANIANGGTNPSISGATSYTITFSNIPVGFNGYKYRCIITGSCPPDITSTVASLNVGSSPPAISAQPVSKQLSTGCSASFSISSPGSGVLYQWQQSIDGGSTWSNISNGGTGPVFSGSTTDLLSLSSVPWSSNNSKYRCIVSNSCGPSLTSDAATLTIPSSSILTHPSNSQLSINCNTVFSVSIPAGYSALYQWQVSSDGGTTWTNLVNGGSSPAYSGATGNSLTLNNVPLSFVGYKYRCSVTSTCGPNEISNPGSILASTGSAFSQHPANTLIYSGQNTSLSIISSGTGYSFRWQVSTNGGSTWSDISDGGTSPAYTGTQNTILYLKNVPLSCNNYRYRCRVTHPCRPNEASNAAILTVPPNSPVTDVDGNVYSTIGIGTQLWMASDLKTTKYRNGDVIGTTSPINLDLTTISDPKYQWPAGGNESNVATYGRLYTWYAITDSRNVCPAGWHVPTNGEWTALENYLISNGYNYDGSTTGDKTGKALAATSNWSVSAAEGTPGNTDFPAYRNKSGFTAYPGGYRWESGFFAQFGSSGYWWSATESNTTNAYGSEIAYNNVYVTELAQLKKRGKLVRCVKD